MNRQQKNRKDRRRFARLMSLALSASMVLSSSVIAYGSPIMDPNAAAAVIAEQAAEDIAVEQQAGDLTAAEVVELSANNTSNKLMYGMTFAELEEQIKTNIIFKATDAMTGTVKQLVYGTDYEFDTDYGLFAISENAFNKYVSANGYEVKFKGLGAYKDNAGFKDAQTVTIEKLTVSEGDAISVNLSSRKNSTYTGVYTGKEQKPDIENVTVSITKHPKTGSSFTISANRSDDFAHIIGDVSYENNVNIGTGKVIVKLNNNYSAGNKVGEATFAIAGVSISDNAVIEYIGSKEFNYNGLPQGPGEDNIKVTVGGRELTAGTDFTVEYMISDNGTWRNYPVSDGKPKSAGTYRAIIKGLGNYGGQFDVEDTQIIKQLQFEIKGNNDFNENNIRITVPDQAYTGKAPNVMESLKVEDWISKATLQNNTDYEFVRYEDASGAEITNTATKMVEPGYYYVVVRGKGAYKSDTIRTSFRIVDGTLDNAVVEWTNNNVEYNGERHAPKVSAVKIPIQNGNGSGYVTLDKSDYTYEDDDPREFVDAGTYQVTIVGKNRYKGTEIVAEYTISPRAITEANQVEVTAVNVQSKADGKKRLCVVVKDKGLMVTDQDGKAQPRELKLGKDYEYKDNGNGTVTVRGLYNYNKEQGKSIGTANKMPLGDAKITAVLTAGSLQYANKALTPQASEFTVREEGATPVELKAGTDYEVVGYIDNNKAGTAIAILNGKGSYEGLKQVEFEIKGIDLSANYTILKDGLLDEVSYSPTANKDYANDIKENLDRRVIAATADMAKKTLIRGKDYRVEFRLNGERVTEVRNAGVYTVVVEGMGEYSGELTTIFTIHGTDINTVLSASLSQNSFDYAGQAIEPEVTVTTKANMDALVKGKDYEIVYADNNKVGKAYAIVRGLGAYEGSISLEFEITGDPSITPVPTPGDEKQTQDITTKYGNTLSRQLGLTMTQTVKGAKTSVTFTSSNPKVATIDKNGKITCKAVGTTVITTTAIESDEYKAVTNKLTLTVMPKKVGVKSLKSTKKRQVVVKSATTTAGNDGYQIQYKNNGTTKRVGVKTSKKSVTRTLKSLKSGTNVQVRIRAYKKVDGKTIFGPYCNWKKVKVK